jgi:effector-binding domain-containing protein
MERIAKAGALAPEPILLSDENSLWGADIYIAVSKDVPGAQMVKVSGTFLTQVFEGPYKNVRQWVKQMADYVRQQGKELKKLYFFYTTCPKCAKYYGKNYVVLLAQI